MKSVVLLLAALLAACGASEKPAPQPPLSPAADDARPTVPAGWASGVTDTGRENAEDHESSGAEARGESVEDPEPSDAQARAEAVVDADFNRDKTTKLAMTMTTLVGRTSKLAGFSTSVAPKEGKIEDQLERLGAKITETEVVIQLPGSILFDFDSANLRPDAHRALTDVSAVIEAYEKRSVRIEGHTDSVASDEYNQTLSERRAGSVADWLAANGVERTRLAAAGYGEKKPTATNDTAAGRQLNRRVEVVIERK